MADMETFHTTVGIDNPLNRGHIVELPDVLVDTGAEATWMPRALLESLGIAVVAFSKVSAAMAMCALTSACYHYAATETPAEASNVRVVFATPREVLLQPRGGSAQKRDAVTELRGRLTAVRGDTLVLDVHELYDARLAAQPIENTEARAVRDSSTTVETWSSNSGQTMGTIGVLGLLFLLLYAAAGSSVY